MENCNTHLETYLQQKIDIWSTKAIIYDAYTEGYEDGWNTAMKQVIDHKTQKEPVSKKIDALLQHKINVWAGKATISDAYKDGYNEGWKNAVKQVVVEFKNQ